MSERKDKIRRIIEKEGTNIICNVLLLGASIFQIAASLSVSTNRMFWMIFPMSGILFISWMILFIRRVKDSKFLKMTPMYLFGIYLIMQSVVGFRYGGSVFLLCIIRVVLYFIMLLAAHTIVFHEDYVKWYSMRHFVLLFSFFPALELIGFLLLNDKTGTHLGLFQTANFLGTEAMFTPFLFYGIVPKEYKLNADVFIHGVEQIVMSSVATVIFIGALAFVYKIPTNFQVIPALFMSYTFVIVILLQGLSCFFSKSSRVPVSDEYSGRLYYLQENKLFAERLNTQYCAVQERMKRVKKEIDTTEGETRELLKAYLADLKETEDILMHCLIEREDLEQLEKERFIL